MDRYFEDNGVLRLMELFEECHFVGLQFNYLVSHG